MEEKKPPGFDQFDSLMRKLVKVPPKAIVDSSTGRKYTLKKTKSKPRKRKKKG